jgi:uncharacterized protein (TIGR02678 family)
VTGTTDSRLGSTQDRESAEDVARAVRMVLAEPLITAGADPDGYELVRKRRERLVQYFDNACGWQLIVDTHARYARLVKVIDRPDGSRPARRRRSGKAPFDRRRYTLLCVICAELLTASATTIGLLAGRTVEATTADPELDAFDPTLRLERAAFVDALQFLESAGAVAAVDGLTDSYLDGADVKVLYRVDASRLMTLLSAPVPPSRIAAAARTGPLDAAADRETMAESRATETPATETPATETPAIEIPAGAVTAATGTPSGFDLDGLLGLLTYEQRYGEAADPAAIVPDTQRNMWLRHSIVRRLLDDPVLYLEDLTEAQRDYLGSLSGRRFIRQAASDAGFDLEERAEGLLLVDPEGIATRDRFPDDRSNAKQTALLILDLLVAADAPLPNADLVGWTRGRLTQQPGWARSYQSEDGAPRLTREAVDVLIDFGLARRDGGLVRALPAAARYTLAPEGTEPATEHKSKPNRTAR